MGAKVKRIRNGLYLIMAILVFFLPAQVFAAGQDGVSLEQEGDLVAVALEMGNAQQEKISAVAVSLQIDEGSRDKVKAEFDFAGELGGAVKGFLYDESTGVLDVYAASDQSLFAEDILNLGYVQVTLKDSGDVLPVEISYLGASFQTANEVYGEKRPMVNRTPEPVKMQVGEGTPGTGDGENPPDNSGGDNGQEGAPGGGNGTDGVPGGSGNGAPGSNSSGSSSGNANIDQGLNDEKTQFKNDPSSAQPITSSVINKNQTHTELTNMSQPAVLTGGSRPGASTSPKLSRPENKVSVVSPANGPSSIHIAKGDQSSSGRGSGTESGEGWADFGQESSGTGFSDGTGEEISGGEGAGGDEILLDQKEGGARKESLTKRNRILRIAGIIAGFSGVAGLGAFGLVKVKGAFAPAKKRRSPGKRSPKKKSAGGRPGEKRHAGRKPVRKKTVGKKTAAQKRRKPVRTGKAMSKGR